METPPQSSFAITLSVVASPVTELASRFKDDAIGHFAQPYIHLFHNIPDADNVAHITENVKAALGKWGEAEKARRGADYETPKRLPVEVVGMGATDEGVIFVDLEELDSLDELYKQLEEHCIGNGTGRDSAVPFFAHPAPEDYPRFDLVRVPRSKAFEIVDELYRTKVAFEGVNGTTMVAGKDSVEVDEVVILQGTPTQWKEVGRVPLV